MIPRSLNELRQHMAYSQNAESAVQDFSPPEYRETYHANISFPDAQNSQGCWPPAQQAWAMPAASGGPSHDADSVQRGNNISQSFPATDSRYLGAQDERFSQYRSNVGIISESQHPIYQEGSCSQTQNGYYPETNSRLHFQGAPQTTTSSRQQHINPSQFVPPQQLSSQTIRTHGALGQQSISQGSSAFSSHRPASFDPCIPYPCHNNSNTNNSDSGNRLNDHSQQMRKSWCMPPAGQGPVAAGSLGGTQNSKTSADAKNLQRTKTGTITSGVSATFSQCCSTQAETVSSTQKANTSEPTKGWKPTLLQPYMRLDGIAQAEDYRYQIYRDTRPGVKAKTWVKCAYCVSNRLYRKKEALKNHMLSQACGWKPETASQAAVIQTNINKQTDKCNETQGQNKRPAALLPRGAAGGTALEGNNINLIQPSQPPPCSEWTRKKPFRVSDANEVPHASQLPPASTAHPQVSAAPFNNNNVAPETHKIPSGMGLLRVAPRGGPPGGPEGGPRVAPQHSQMAVEGSWSAFAGGEAEGSFCGLEANRVAHIQNAQASPKPSDVSTCLEELPLEQLLGRLSEKDIQILMQASSSSSSRRECVSAAAMQFPPSLAAGAGLNARKRVSTEEAQVLLPSTGDGKARAQQQQQGKEADRSYRFIITEDSFSPSQGQMNDHNQLKPFRKEGTHTSEEAPNMQQETYPTPTEVVASPLHQPEGSDSVQTRTPHQQQLQQLGQQQQQHQRQQQQQHQQQQQQQQHQQQLQDHQQQQDHQRQGRKVAPTAKKSKQPNAVKPGTTHRSFGVQTTLNMRHLEKALQFYASRQKEKKNKKPKKEIKEERKEKTLTQEKGSIKPQRAMVKKAAIVTRAKTKGIIFQDRKKTEKKEMRGDDEESALKRSTRLWQRQEDRKGISEVLRQESIEYPLLMVGASLLIKDKRCERWEAATIGAYCPSTQKHEVLIASALKRRLRLFEHEMLFGE